MFVDEDCLDSRSDVWPQNTRLSIWREKTSKIRRLLQFDGFITEDGNLVVDCHAHHYHHRLPRSSIETIRRLSSKLLHFLVTSTVNSSQSQTAFQNSDSVTLTGGVQKFAIDFRPINRCISKTVQDKHIVTIYNGRLIITNHEKKCAAILYTE